MVGIVDKLALNGTMIAMRERQLPHDQMSREESRGGGADPTADQIARALEKDIVLGRLKPGEKLREEDLAVRFSASRHHVREGLARLERIGIVVKERNRGVSVRHFTADEVRQIYE